MYRLCFENEKEYAMAKSDLKKLSIPAYKQLIFNTLPALQSGNFTDAKQVDGKYELRIYMYSFLEKSVFALQSRFYCAG